MFEGVLEVADELSTKVSTFKNQRDNRRVRIGNFFEKVGTCLEKIVQAMEANESFDGHLDELDSYVKSFSAAVGDIIGFEKTDQLTALLNNAFNQINFNKLKEMSGLEFSTHRKVLKEGSDKFLDLWEALS